MFNISRVPPNAFRRENAISTTDNHIFGVALRRGTDARRVAEYTAGVPGVKTERWPVPPVGVTDGRRRLLPIPADQCVAAAAFRHVVLGCDQTADNLRSVSHPIRLASSGYKRKAFVYETLRKSISSGESRPRFAA